jgi:hypothetical protein
MSAVPHMSALPERAASVPHRSGLAAAHAEHAEHAEQQAAEHAEQQAAGQLAA